MLGGSDFLFLPSMSSAGGGGAKLPKAGAEAVEPLFSSALQALTTAQPGLDPDIFLASATARLAGLSIRKSASSSTTEAGVQCNLPWVSHSAGSSASSSSATTYSPTRTPKPVAQYLQQPTVEQLERIMDATLRACSARAKSQIPAPSTDDEWRALAATEMIRESGLSLALEERKEIGLQASVGAFASHASLCMKRAASPSA